MLTRVRYFTYHIPRPDPLSREEWESVKRGSPILPDPALAASFSAERHRLRVHWVRLWLVIGALLLAGKIVGDTTGPFAWLILISVQGLGAYALIFMPVTYSTLTSEYREFVGHLNKSETLARESESFQEYVERTAAIGRKR